MLTSWRVFYFTAKGSSLGRTKNLWRFETKDVFFI